MDELKCKEIILNSVKEAASVQSNEYCAKIYICKFFVMALSIISDFI